jgi:uncharacterized protein involved in response to NO
MSHYLKYPDEKNIPTYLAYGFRPAFLLVAPYIIISMLLWGLVWSGVLNLTFTDNLLAWHIYEMIFGIMSAGVLAFLTTGLPELFPGMVPFVGKRLKYVIILWILGRVSFWFIDFTGVYLAAFLNLAMIAWIIWFAKDAVLDKLQRHASLGYILVLLFLIEAWFFASMSGLVSSEPLEILKLSLGAVVILVLLAMRRVNMEAINELMEDKEIDDVFRSRPPLSNLAIFSVLVFSVVEYLYPNNSALGWLGLATGAAILAITSDYILKDKFILNQPYVIYLGLVYVLLSLGYATMGLAILSEKFEYISSFRHIVSSGGYGLAFVMVMMIVSYIHTGRHLVSNIYTHLMVAFVVIAAFMRASVALYPEYSSELYLYSAIVWTLPFVIYIKVFYNFLLTPRADGIKG